MSGAIGGDLGLNIYPGGFYLEGYALCRRPGLSFGGLGTSTLTFWEAILAGAAGWTRVEVVV